MIRYAITDAELPRGQARQLAKAGVDFLQLREPRLGAAALVELARSIQDEIHGTAIRLLIHSRADVAMAAGAAGVHLTARDQELTAAQVRQVFALAKAQRPVVSASCHTLEAALRARDAGADLILFAPVFEKRVHGALVLPGVGLQLLREVCDAVAPLKVLALGGVTAENAGACMRAGAAGIAGIRIFL